MPGFGVFAGTAFTEVSADLGFVAFELRAGRVLQLRVAPLGDSGADVRLAFGVADFDSRLEITVPDA